LQRGRKGKDEERNMSMKWRKYIYIVNIAALSNKRNISMYQQKAASIIPSNKRWRDEEIT
jgi:hypothetical protein